MKKSMGSETPQEPKREGRVPRSSNQGGHSTKKKKSGEEPGKWHCKIFYPFWEGNILEGVGEGSKTHKFNVVSFSSILGFPACGRRGATGRGRI